MLFIVLVVLCLFHVHISSQASFRSTITVPPGKISILSTVYPCQLTELHMTLASEMLFGAYQMPCNMVDSDGNNTNKAYYEIPGNATQYLMYNGTAACVGGAGARIYKCHWNLTSVADDQTASCLMLDNYDSTKDAKVSVNYTYYNASDSSVARAQSLTGNTASSTYTSISCVYTIVVCVLLLGTSLNF